MVAPPASLTQVSHDVRAGLETSGQKSLPSRLLYDELGSALFEVISLLPEYGLTRADERILSLSSCEIVSLLPRPLRVVELGSGSARKTRWILGELAASQAVPYHPIDVSEAALASSRASLFGMRAISVDAIAGEYLPGLRAAAARRRGPERLFVLFLGSTIGNFEPRAAERFLAQVRSVLVPGDALLLGTDLVKPVPRLLAAYDDALGVTAAFNMNLLARLNRELGGAFELSQFEHSARWNESERDIEMHLVSRREQSVPIRALDLVIHLRAGETIWTESSHKYELDEPLRLGERTGFARAGQWLDREWPFAETLLIAR